MDNMEKQAIITVLGRDRVGIIAAVSAELAKGDVNILDINQTILGDTFTMVMLVDYSAMKIEFSAMKDNLDELSKQLGVEIRMQRKAIFDAMHRI
jgi:ACT domain-containing protein